MNSGDGIERMAGGGEGRLQMRLDEIEARGRRALSHRARAEALRHALIWAGRGVALGGAMLILIAVLRPVSPLAAVLTLVLAGAAACGLTYLRADREARSRAAALALFDHRFNMKDRIQTVDEFNRIHRPSPYHQAALQEAAPWIDRAAQADLALDAQMTVRPWRVVIWPALGVALTLVAIVLPPLSGSEVSRVYEVDARRAGLVAGADGADAALSTAAGPKGAPSSTGETSSGGAGRGGEAQAPNLLRRLANMLGVERGAGVGADTRDRAAGAGAQAAAAGAGKSSTEGSQGGMGGGASPASAGDSQAESRRAPPPPSNGSAADDAAAAVTAGQQSSSPSGRQEARVEAEVERPAQSESASSSQSGEGRQPTDRSRRGDQNSSNRDQSGGQGEGGRRTGGDTGPKKGRGFASLMLATPMQDRLTGMTSPGPMTTTTRQASPQPLPMAPGQASDRGVALGQAGRSAPRALTAHDRQVTRDYFVARNGAGR